MSVPWHQTVLADLIEKGLWYKPQGKADTLIENHKFWFNDLSEDQLLDAWIIPEERKKIMGYYVDAFGFALVGKCKTPDKAKQELKRLRSHDMKRAMIQILGIPEKLFNAVDKLQDNGRVKVTMVVSILRTRSIS